MTSPTPLPKPAIEGGKAERDQFLVFGAPDIQEAEIQEVVDTLRSRWIGTGPKAARFETQFREYKAASHAIAVNSCTAALHLSMVALGLRAGDEVITTPMTFCATANAILHTGATPVFADCDRDSMNIDPAQIERKITPKTRAILPVHFAGRPCQMDKIMALAKKHRLHVVEDCAHAIESQINNRACGTFGEAGCFSFYVTKNVTTAEGGMVITEDAKMEERIKRLALHGMSKDAWKRFGDSGYRHYGVVEAGFKYNMTDLQASMGIHQLARVEANWKRRQALWKRYMTELANLPCQLPSNPEPGTRHGYHLFTILIDTDQLRVDRDHVLNALTKENIGVGVHYVALSKHPFYQQFLKKGERFSNAEYISDRTISLPLSPALSDDDLTSVVRAVQKILLYYRKS